MPINSRAKGAQAEREFRNVLRAHGYSSARRGQQFSGSPDSPDVVCEELSQYHWEIKRTESLSLYPAMEQAIRDAGSEKTPVVAHRRNNKEWLVVLRADDFLKLVEQAESGEAFKRAVMDAPKLT